MERVVRSHHPQKQTLVAIYGKAVPWNWSEKLDLWSGLWCYMWCVSAHHAKHEAHAWTSLECQNTKMLQMSQQGKDVLENVKKCGSSQTEHWKASSMVQVIYCVWMPCKYCKSLKTMKYMHRVVAGLSLQNINLPEPGTKLHIQYYLQPRLWTDHWSGSVKMNIFIS
jgi:hypothetical protein